MTSDFPARFTQLVDEYGGTIPDLANALRVSKQTISAWKSGARSPKQPTVEHVARFFDVSIPWLMGLDVPRGTFSIGAGVSSDEDRLEALHQNPRLGLLFDRARKLSDEDIDFMVAFADRIMKERDGDD